MKTPRISGKGAAQLLALALFCSSVVGQVPQQSDDQGRPRRVGPVEVKPPDPPDPVSPPQNDDQIELRSDLVMLTASVADSAGHPVCGLKQSDFKIFEDGKPQSIEIFEPVGDPYSLMLLLDTSGSTATQVDEMRAAAREFIAGIGEKDRLGIMTFSRGINTIGDLTSDRTELSKRVDSIGPTVSRDPKKGRYDESTGTSYYDAIFLACTDSPLAADTSTGRRALVIFSDCVDSTSAYSYSEIVDAVERSGISVYILLFDTQDIAAQLLTQPAPNQNRINFSQSQLKRFYNAYDPGSADVNRDPRSFTNLERIEVNDALYDLARAEATKLAERTGGRIHNVKSISDLGAAYREIANELHTRYSIGYYPTNTRQDGSWRKLRVDIAGNPKATVVTRPGYWAPKN